MDVYLVPTGRDRYELYCEVKPAGDEGEADAEPRGSLWARASHSFRRAVAEGEEADGDESTPDAAREQPAKGRARRFITRKLAQAVAEQRLLWHLRRQGEVRLIHPDDLDATAAIARSRTLLTADRDKHRRRSVVNALLLAASGPFALVPGPNLLAYYFTFRTVGHFLSTRGADHGLARVSWQTVPSADLTAIRGALGLDPGNRRQRVDDLARSLGLEKLPRFVTRVADPTP